MAEIKFADDKFKNNFINLFIFNFDIHLLYFATYGVLDG